MRFQSIFNLTDIADSFSWVRADIKRECVAAGCDNQLNDSIRHSHEALYCWSDGFKGLLGQPIKVLGGISYQVSDSTSLTAAGEFGENYLIKTGQTHKLDKNW